MAENHDSRINTGRPGTASAESSERSRVLDRQQNYPNETEERNAAKRRLNDTGTGAEPDGVEERLATADTRARTGEGRERVRNTAPFGDWDSTGPVAPDPELQRPPSQPR